MSEEQILSMLERGSITADEAARLLEAITREDEGAGSGPDSPTRASTEPDQVLPGSFVPNAKRWKHIQQIPFAISLIVLIISAWGLYAVYHRANARITLGWVVILIAFLLAVFATVVSFWMLTAPWLHVRIHEHDGKRIAISLPIPLTLANWGIGIARHYVDDRTAEHLDASAEFLRAMRKEQRRSEPIAINVDEGDQRVQIYIG